MYSSARNPTSPLLSVASMCELSDSLMVCQLKKGQCSPVGAVFSPPGGPVKAVTSCATATGVVLGPQFYMSIGEAEGIFLRNICLLKKIIKDKHDNL